MKYLVLLFLFSCSNIVQKLDINTVYKKDVVFTVNGKKITGMGVVPKAMNYEVVFEYPQGKIDLLSLYTCHRDKQLPNEGSKATYQFTPTDLDLDCPLQIEIYDKKGRHGWGFLLFERPELQLPAKLLCNGEITIAKGMSVCQAKIGTTQRISFGYPVTVDPEKGCPISQKGTDFEYEIVKDLCYYGFIDSSGNLHNHVSFGYETFIFRD